MKRRTANNQDRISGSSRRHVPRMLFLTLLVVLASSCTGRRHARPDRLVFAGLKHNDLAGAHVDRALVVDRIGTSGQDGLATNVAPALEWEVDLRLVGIESGATITYSAVTDRPVSTMVWKEEDRALEISASFERSPTYSLEISNGGTTVLTRSAIPNGDSILSFVCVPSSLPPPDPVPPGFNWCRVCLNWPCTIVIIHFKAIASPLGECQWGITLSEPVELVAGERVVLGDRILLTEEHVSDHAHGPMVFTQMRIQAGRLSSITILDERVERPR